MLEGTDPAGGLDVVGWLAYIACQIRNVPAWIVNGVIYGLNALVDLVFPGAPFKTILTNAGAEISGHVPFSWINASVAVINSAVNDADAGTSLPATIHLLNRDIEFGPSIEAITPSLTGLRTPLKILMYIGFAYWLLGRAMAFFSSGKETGTPYVTIGYVGN